MNSSSGQSNRVVSGMRATGALHLGHYHGVLANWIKLQHEYECLFFAADWHALTTHYEDTSSVKDNCYNMIIDWLSAGVNPNSAIIFIQSHVPETAELHLLLSMITPLGWLERVPTYKEQKNKIKDKDLETYGFLGYPVLMSSDVLTFKGGLVPVGEDQSAHLEMLRELARRFNHIYGRDSDYIEKAEAAIKKLGKKTAKLYREQLRRYQESGESDALETGRALIDTQKNTSISDKERLIGYLEGGGKLILPEPQILLTENAKMPGLDGQKMSKSYGNIIGLREAPESVEQKIKKMPTDPARVRRSDPGEPEKCPVWDFHQLYSDADCQQWVQEGCRSAGIGCLDCKKPLIQSIQESQAPFIERGQELENDPSLLRGIVAEGAEKARDIARETLDEVREAIGID